MTINKLNASGVAVHHGIGEGKKMRISVIGCGYLGAVHAACMAKLGHEVVGIDVDKQKIAALSDARAPFYEPLLETLLEEVQATGRLTFTTEMSAAAESTVHFICVGTPQKKGENGADLTFVDTALDALLPYLSPGDIVVGKSTVPVGTAARLSALVKDNLPGAHLVWNPEFLREGHAVADTLHPDRFVYGVSNGSEDHPAVAVLDDVYSTPLASGTPRLVTDHPTAELVKAAANSFLATKISFINAMAEVCEAAGADVTQLADAIGMDDRIGRKFLNAGIGFGGGCLPKDIRAFMARAGELGADQALTFLREVDAINMRRRTRVVELARDLCDGSLLGKRITVLGAAFKPESDDVRDSPALSIAAQLQLQGAVVTVTDPKALGNAARRFPELHYEADSARAVQNADALLLLTEWQEYRDLDPYEVAAAVSSLRVLDGRNVLDSAKWRAAGWNYRGLGRP
jgi:UDPglucose 6-dehydrogenase